MQIFARSTLDTSFFRRVKQRILGKEYDLSVVICGDARAKKLNQLYRNKTYTPNVLSFPLSQESGEIFINVAQVLREAHRYGHTSKEHAHFLFIHGCLHLKGHLHGSTMEQAECQMMRQLFPGYACSHATSIDV